jgi:hypothetical protein
MIKHFSQMRRFAQEPEENPIPETPDMEDNVTDELDMDDEVKPEESVDETPKDNDSEKNAIKFKLWAEDEAKKNGYTVEITPSSSNRAAKVLIDDSTDIITQKDAVRLSVILDNNTLNWKLMDEPLVKSGGSWVIKFAKTEV